MFSWFGKSRVRRTHVDIKGERHSGFLDVTFFMRTRGAKGSMFRVRQEAPNVTLPNDIVAAPLPSSQVSNCCPDIRGIKLGNYLSDALADPL